MSQFSKDEKWLEAKKIAKASGFQDDWIAVIDCYVFLGGKFVQLYAITENDKFRVLGLSDSEQLLLLNREGQVVTGDYNEIFESRKHFFYNDIPNEVEKELPEGLTYNGSTKLSLHV